MKPDESIPSEERWTDLLAAFDDALAVRVGSNPLETIDLPSDCRAQLQKEMAYAQRVRQALARHAS